MNILLLGGTQFVGRHIAEALVAAGHSLSILTRGKTPDELPPQVERLRGDRDAGTDGLAALCRRTWDACVDTSGFTPRQVRPSAELLSGSVGQYVFMSAVSVYGDPHQRPVLESHSRPPPAGEDVTEIDSQTYGPLKVACEDIVERIYGTRCTLLRPQIIAGPYDPYDRFSYWARRAAQGGEMLAPGDGSDHVQVIDARDVAQFTLWVIERRIAGPFNLAGHRLTWARFLALLDARDLVWVPAQLLRAAGVTEFELPLYRPEHGPRSGLMDVSNARAVRAGLRLTDLAITAHDTRAWLEMHELPPALSRAREVALIHSARQSRPAEPTTPPAPPSLERRSRP